jgi:hypothetical protein
MSSKIVITNLADVVQLVSTSDPTLLNIPLASTPIKLNVCISDYPIETRFALPQLVVDGKRIKYVTSWPHIGNIIEQIQLDSHCISMRCLQSIGQLNNVILVFCELKTVAQYDLLYKFCSGFYGSVLWDIQSHEVACVCSTR